MNKFELKNKITVLAKKNNNTPRVAAVLYAKPSKDEKITGLNYLMTRLMLDGTKKYNREQLADYLDENAIEIVTEKKADYIRIKLLCLNEDLEKGIEILSDIIFNSTFDELEKEKLKIKGEFEADLDSPKIKAQDEYYRTVFQKHPYGTGRNEILDNIDKITKEDILEEYDAFKYRYPKNISYAGDFDVDVIKPLFEKYFGELKIEDEKCSRSEVSPIKGNKISTVKKEDANQAQIFMGRIFPSVYDKHYPEFLLLNTILGSSGLSSRLFLELREKQGLAYTVRSVLEPYVFGGDFYVYIATEPSNIKKSIDGFKKELNKIMTEIISDEELENAKNNAVGKRSFYKETNLAEASLNGYYECINLGYEFEEKLIENIKKITKEQIKETAEKYLSTDYALTVLAPEKYLKESGLISQ